MDDATEPDATESDRREPDDRESDRREPDDRESDSTESGHHTEPGAAKPGDAEPGHTGPGAAAGGGPGDADEGAELPGRDPRRFNEWRKRSATGVVMSGIALGLREALELPDQRPAVVVEAPGEPTDPDAPIELHFDPDDPAGSVAVVRQREEDAGRRDDGSPEEPTRRS